MQTCLKIGVTLASFNSFRKTLLGIDKSHMEVISCVVAAYNAVSYTSHEIRRGFKTGGKFQMPQTGFTGFKIALLLYMMPVD